MTEQEYNKIWNDTMKAIAYINRKGIPYYPKSKPDQYKGRTLLSFVVGTHDPKIICHVLKQYPDAWLSFSSTYAVIKHENEMTIKLIETAEKTKEV